MKPWQPSSPDRAAERTHDPQSLTANAGGPLRSRPVSSGQRLLHLPLRTGSMNRAEKRRGHAGNDRLALVA